MRRLETHKPFVVYSVNDPALDRSTAEGVLGLQQYLMTRDETKIVWLPGGERTTYHCRPLTHQARLWAEQMTMSEAMRLTAIFRACVTRIEGLVIDGEPWQAEMMPTHWNDRILTDECVAKLSNVGLSPEVLEVGLVCETKASLTPEKKRVFRLPHGFVLTPPRLSGAAIARTSASASPRSTGRSPAAESPPTTSPSTEAATAADPAKDD